MKCRTNVNGEAERSRLEDGKTPSPRPLLAQSQLWRPATPACDHNHTPSSSYILRVFTSFAHVVALPLEAFHLELLAQQMYLYSS